MMTRRMFLCGLTLETLAAPLAAKAQQQAAKVYRIGYLAGGSSTRSLHTTEAFRQGLRELG